MARALLVASVLLAGACATAPPAPSIPVVVVDPVAVQPPPELGTAPPAAKVDASPAGAEGETDEPASAATEAEIVGSDIRVPGPVLYLTGRDTLSPESQRPLSALRDLLKSHPDVTLLRIEVHTDDRGAAQMNQKLSEARALAVARWLVAAGVDCRRVIPVGFGSSRPLARGETAEARAKNRRTVFAVATLRGRPVAGMPVDGGGRVSGDPCRR